MDSLIIFLIVGGLLAAAKLFFAFLWYTQRVAHKRAQQDLTSTQLELDDALSQLEQARSRESELSSQLKVAEARTEEQLKHHQQLNEELDTLKKRLKDMT